MPFKSVPKLYWVWQSMKERCRNPKIRQWSDYGGRGITVCARWANSFQAFCDDMGERPPGYVMDRIDNDKGYEPSNCRWVDKKASQRNRRVTRTVTVEGVTYVAADLADRSGLKTDAIVIRASRGLTLAEVLDPKRRVFTDGLALGGKASGAKKMARTHCSKGHEFTPETTYVRADGGRTCRLCRRRNLP